MNFQPIKKEHLIYFKQVLGLDSYFATKERKKYSRLVLVDEPLNANKADLLNKILSAYGWQKVEVLSKTDIEKHSQIEEALIFGRHLEEDRIAQSANAKLIAPSLQDLLDEPDLKKVLWRKMKSEMEKRK